MRVANNALKTLLWKLVFAIANNGENVGHFLEGIVH